MVIDASPEILLTILVLLVIGILVILVWLINYIAGPSIKKKKGKEKRPSVQFALEPSSEPSGPSPVIVEDAKERRSLPMGAREVMRVLRDEYTGAIIVEVGGNRYRRLTDIRDGRIGNQVLEAIADLIKFTGGVVRGQWAAASVTPVVPTRERPPRSQVVGPVGSPQVAAVEPPGSGGEEAFLRRLREGDLQVGQTPKGAPGMMGFMRRRKPQVAAEETGAGGTFVDEIEEILQRMISAASVPLGEEVHVRTGPDGGLQIQVGVQYFSRSDEVPDPATRALIQAAVEEWERS